MIKNKVVINSENLKGEKVEVSVVRPKAKQLKDSQLEYNRAFRKALESGALLRQKLDDYLEDQKLWDEAKQTEYDNLVSRICESEKKLAQGGIKLAEAKDIALQMRRDRIEFRILIAERTAIDSVTAEGQADTARFISLMQSCLLAIENGPTYYSSIDEYEDNAEEPFVVEAAGILAEMLYELDPNYDSNLPENKFLKDYKFVNEDLRLINDDGSLVDVDGKLVDEEGRYIDEEGNFIDRDGNPVKEDGTPIVEFTPFIDDEGKEIPDPLAKKKKPRTKKKEEEKVETSSGSE